MQKVENSLLLAVLFLFVWSLTVTGSMDLHLHDTYFVIAGVSALRFLAGFFLILFGLYKTIRHRHDVINLFIAVPHILLTFILIGSLLASFGEKRNYVEFSTWQAEGKLLWCAVGLMSFLLIQVIFLIYFLVQIIKKPAPGDL